MISTNTMQRGFDGFSFRRQALLKARVPLDFSYETSIEGLEISGTEPDGTTRRVIFEVDGKLYRFGNAGLDQYDERGELEDILREGNTVSELLAVREFPNFLGKKVYVIIALDAPAESPVYPKIKIGAKVKSYNDVYTKYEYSPEYELSGGGKVVEIRVDKNTNGNAVMNVWCRLKHPVTGWGEWIIPAEAQNKLATAIQYRLQYILTTLDGSDYAQVNNIFLRYVTESDKLSGSTMEVITAAQDYPNDLGTCYALIKHTALNDCNLKAYVKYSKPVERRNRVQLGHGTGERQTLALMNDSVLDRNVAQDTIHIEAGGKTLTGIEFDTQDSTVTFTADKDAEVVGSWESGLSDELWREMEQDISEVETSRFIYRLTDSKGNKVSAVKFQINRLGGYVDAQVIGVGTGLEQIYALPHRAKLETLSCTGDWKYDETSQLLKVVAPAGTPVIVSYSWVGRFPEVKEYICGWTAKI